MSEYVSETFYEIGQRMLTETAAVKCSAADYRDGLRGIIDEIKTAIAASEETDPA